MDGDSSVFQYSLFERDGSGQNAPKERRRRRAGEWSSNRVFLESPFSSLPLKVSLALKNT